MFTIQTLFLQVQTEYFRKEIVGFKRATVFRKPPVSKDSHIVKGLKSAILLYSFKSEYLHTNSLTLLEFTPIA